MPEKGVIPVSVPLVPRHKSCLSKSLPTLVIALFCLMLLVWSIDSCTLRNRIRLRQNRRAHLDLGLHFTVPAISPPELPADTHFNASLNTLSPPRNSANEFVRDGGGDVDGDREVPVYRNTTKSSSRVVLDWISVPLEADYTSTLLARWLSPKGSTCSDARTTNITIPGLDGRNPIELSTGDIHEFVIHAYAEDGTRRCSGGDYFETDVSGERWKSRPPVKDLGNGSYVFTIQVHPDFSGEYTLTVVLLFRSFEGLKISTEKLAYRKELRNIPIKLSTSAAQLPEIRLCGEGDSDFGPEIWSGRWTRHGRNDKCEIDYDGRYRCLAADYPCESPWCKGPLGSLESNGWVYSAHCSFKIFSGEEAWKCLKNRWIFFWGDSNHVDTIRNILNFILYHPEIKAVPRRFDMNFTNPRDSSQTVRITSIFNGHWNETMNYQGLNSLADPGYRELLKKYFSEDTVPDVMIMNSGLHDGIHWRSIRAYAQGADAAVKFWEEVLNSVRERGKVAPKFIYRTTVATGGYARALAFNPSKIEAFNLVLLDKLRKKGMLDGVVDEFDMTFPWHFDNRCNDGVHYGRGPAKLPWKDGVIGHQYFVDLMLAHVLFNAICPL